MPRERPPTPDDDDDDDNIEDCEEAGPAEALL